eukprot:m.257254 g.257254  ORF g.257254 m.257254 type:complete len:231 (-) comp15525_c9_seq6:398-1090(-)
MTGYMLSVELNLIMLDLATTIENQLTCEPLSKFPNDPDEQPIDKILPQEAADAECEGVLERCHHLIGMLVAMLKDLKERCAQYTMKVPLISVDGKGHFARGSNDRERPLETLEPLELCAIEAPGHFSASATTLHSVGSVDELLASMGPILDGLHALAGPKTTAFAVMHYNRLHQVVDWLEHHSLLRKQTLCELQLQGLIDEVYIWCFIAALMIAKAAVCWVPCLCTCVAM